jgi:hypothetical protein
MIRLQRSIPRQLVKREPAQLELHGALGRDVSHSNCCRTNLSQAADAPIVSKHADRWMAPSRQPSARYSRQPGPPCPSAKTARTDSWPALGEYVRVTHGRSCKSSDKRVQTVQTVSDPTQSVPNRASPALVAIINSYGSRIFTRR